jgi:GrpB-like predicted nucleotidyltransferase (UPF0157 family)
MILEKYKSSWIQDFTDIEKLIDEALVNLNISIEHIGSTSVPELAAKPIIDIDIVFDTNVEFTDIKLRLQNVGYVHAGNQGIENREVFKRAKLLNHKILDSITHHLYVCPIESQERKKHLLFRDFLRANADARIEYQKLKYEIAEEANHDKKKYADLKEIKAKQFFNSIFEKAEHRSR